MPVTFNSPKNQTTMKEMRPNQKVLLGMSGGTDSSVAALLLLDAGYEVTGVTFRLYEKDGSAAYCDEAARLCARLGIPHVVYDAREAFRRSIVRYFVDEYMAGRTPVPCTRCNHLFKWPLLRQLADERGIWHLATGHYVQKRFVDGRWYIAAGTDADKDQSFFLWGLPQDMLERMLLPMGTLCKSQVRRLAAERGYQQLATKRDSLGVCFCPGDYRSFLRQEVGEGPIRPGWFYDEEGRCLGKHEGYPFYTIGQRRGLGIHLNKAVFVKEILPDENRVILSDRLSALEQTSFRLKEWQLVCPEEALHGQTLIVRIRYRKQATPCTLHPAADGSLCVCLLEPLAAIAPGQAAVFYQADRVLGGGIIL